MVSAARAGEMKIIAPMLRRVPMKEQNMPTPRALPAWPFRAMGRPSKQVAMEEGVPGMLRRIAETSPPEVPPM